MRPHDFIPRKDIEFHVWITNFLSYLSSTLERFGVPSATYERLRAEADDFTRKYKIAGEPGTRTSVMIHARTASRKVLESDVRQVVRQFLAHNPAVTDADRDNFGIRVYIKSRHPAAVAANIPYIHAEAYGLRRVRFRFGDADGSTAKPAGQHGTEIAWVIAETKPANIDGLVHSSFSTRTPLILTFDEPERGKTVWHAARWENTRGEKGPWSEILSVIIP